jgi:hypothetical protein
VSALAKLLAPLLSLLPLLAAAAEPVKGSLNFDLFAMSQEGAACAAKPEVEQYLEHELIPAFTKEWSKQGHDSEPADLVVDFQFELGADGRVSHSAIRTAEPKTAGTAVHDCFKAATPAPLPEAARCLVGETYGYRIRRVR